MLRLLSHPPFKATLTGFRKTRLRKVHFCPRLAETKRKNIILDHMNSRICLGCSRYWLHKSDLINTNTAISLNQWERRLNANVTIVIHFPPRDIQSSLMGQICEFGTPEICPGGPKIAKKKLGNPGSTLMASTPLPMGSNRSGWISTQFQLF